MLGIELSASHTTDKCPPLSYTLSLANPLKSTGALYSPVLRRKLCLKAAEWPTVVRSGPELHSHNVIWLLQITGHFLKYYFQENIYRHKLIPIMIFSKNNLISSTCDPVLKANLKGQLSLIFFMIIHSCPCETGTNTPSQWLGHHWSYVKVTSTALELFPKLERSKSPFQKEYTPSISYLSSGWD